MLQKIDTGDIYAIAYSDTLCVSLKDNTTNNKTTDNETTFDDHFCNTDLDFVRTRQIQLCSLQQTDRSCRDRICNCFN